jgi:hypothetical protein
MFRSPKDHHQGVCTSSASVKQTKEVILATYSRCDNQSVPIQTTRSQQWRTQDFFRGGGRFTLGIFFGGGGVQQIQGRTEGRENGDMGAVAP